METTTYTSNKTLHNTNIFCVKEKLEISENLKNILLFLRDKINKFGDIKTLLSPGGQYEFLVIEKRPTYSFLDLSDKERFDLHLELLKMKQNINTLSDFLSKKDKEYKKTFMPKLNIILSGSRSCPPTSEVIDIIGVEEVELRIDKALAYLDAIMFPQGLGGVKAEII